MKKILGIGCREEMHVYIGVRIFLAMKPQAETFGVCQVARNRCELLHRLKATAGTGTRTQERVWDRGTAGNEASRERVAHSWWKSTK